MFEDMELYFCSTCGETFAIDTLGNCPVCGSLNIYPDNEEGIKALFAHEHTFTHIPDELPQEIFGLV